jgi:hypothetical protein
VPTRKNKRGRIVEEGSSSAQEGGAQQNYVPLYGGIPTPPSYYGGPPMQAWRSSAAMPPPNYVVPNVAFAEPYAQFPQPQQSVAIIGGYVARNMQNIAAIQANAAQLGEGNANIAYELGRLHLAPPEQFIGGGVQSYYEQGTIKIINTNHRWKIRERRSFSFLFFFPFSLNFSLCMPIYA